MFKKNKFGFTLIELLVVIAIIGLLSVIAVVAVRDIQRKARVAKVNQTVEQYFKALSLYYADYKYYPYNGSLHSCLGDYAPDADACWDLDNNIIKVNNDFENEVAKYIPSLPKDVVTCPGSPAGKYYNYIYTCAQPQANPSRCPDFSISWALETSDPSQCNILGAGQYSGNLGDQCIFCYIQSQ